MEKQVRHREAVRRYYAKPEKREARRQYEKIQRGSPAWRERRKQYRQRACKKLREQLFGMLGSECVLCGDNHPPALTVDHINGGGKKHRDKVGGGASMYRDIIRNPEAKSEYRILCMKCNWLRRWDTDEEIIARYGTHLWGHIIDGNKKK